MRTAPALLGLVLGLTTLAGCGQSETEAYCEELKADQATLTSVGGDNPDLTKLDDAAAVVHKLAGQAPDAVAGDWKTFDGALTEVEGALKDAGVSFADLPKLQSGQVPEGVDVNKLQALAPRLQELSSGELGDARKAISTHAQDTCDVDIFSG